MTNLIWLTNLTRSANLTDLVDQLIFFWIKKNLLTFFLMIWSADLDDQLIFLADQLILKKFNDIFWNFEVWCYIINKAKVLSTDHSDKCLIISWSIIYHLIFKNEFLNFYPTLLQKNCQLIFQVNTWLAWAEVLSFDLSDNWMT